MILINPMYSAERLLTALQSSKITSKGVDADFLKEYRIASPTGDHNGAKGVVSVGPGGTCTSDGYNSVFVGREAGLRGIHSRGPHHVWGSQTVREDLDVHGKADLAAVRIRSDSADVITEMGIEMTLREFIQQVSQGG